MSPSGGYDAAAPAPFQTHIGDHRMCPGRYFAQDSLFIHIASLLHVFNVGPPLGEGGKPIKIKFEQSDGFLSYVALTEFIRECPADVLTPL